MFFLHFCVFISDNLNVFKRFLYLYIFLFLHFLYSDFQFRLSVLLISVLIFCFHNLVAFPFLFQFLIFLILVCFYLNSDLFYVFLILVYFCLNFDFLCISYFHFGCVFFQVVCLFGNINFSIKLVSHDLESVFKLFVFLCISQNFCILALLISAYLHIKISIIYTFSNLCL